MRISAKYLGPDGADAPKQNTHHDSLVTFDHDQKGFLPKCSCGWEFNGVFSSKVKAEFEWWEHCRDNDGSKVAEQLKQREETARQARAIVAEFTRKKKT